MHHTCNFKATIVSILTRLSCLRLLHRIHGDICNYYIRVWAANYVINAVCVGCVQDVLLLLSWFKVLENLLMVSYVADDDDGFCGDVSKSFFFCQWYSCRLYVNIIRCDKCRKGYAWEWIHRLYCEDNNSHSYVFYIHCMYDHDNGNAILRIYGIMMKLL